MSRLGGAAVSPRTFNDQSEYQTRQGPRLPCQRDVWRRVAERWGELARRSDRVDPSAQQREWQRRRRAERESSAAYERKVQDFRKTGTKKAIVLDDKNRKAA